MPHSHHPSEEELEAAISRRGLFSMVPLPKAYRAEYQALEIEEGRARLSVAVLLGVGTFLGFLALSWWVLPDVGAIDGAGRVGIGLPYGILTYVIIQRARSYEAQQIAAGSLAVIYSMWLCWVTSISTSPVAPVLITSNSIVIIFVIVMMRMALKFAFLFSTLATLIQLVTSVALAGYGAPSYVTTLTINTSIALAGLYALHELHNERRRSFLMSVRDRIRLMQVNEQNAHLDRLSETDALTELTNRRGLDRYLTAQDADSGGSLIECLLMDVDNFKAYNDTYGHLTGDKALRAIGRALRSAEGKADVVCRYGGEEFAMVRRYSQDADLALGSWAEAIRHAIEALAIPHVANLPAGTITVSIGAATSRHGQASAEVVPWADEALYAAKAAGRNRVVEHAKITTAARLASDPVPPAMARPSVYILRTEARTDPAASCPARECATAFRG